MLYQTLSQADIDNIQGFIGGFSYTRQMAQDLEYVLRYWDCEKEQLYKMFGNNLILKRKISYSPDAVEKNTVMNQHMKSDIAFIDFRDKVYNLLMCRAELNPYRYDLLGLFNCQDLCENKYQGKDIEIIFPGEKKPYKIVFGMKIMKALRKIAKVYDLEQEYETFRLAHSQIFNTMKYHGTLCLSIHPIDYMSMSVNGYNWNSCMEWPEGCHSLGTVEMMNSKMVVVAYLEGDKPFEWNYCGKRYSCPNKKWRELFIVTPEIISEIKGYPYQNENLANECLKWLRDLATNFFPNTEYGDDLFAYKDRPIIFDCGKGKREFLDLIFDCGYMYNDFGALCHHSFYLNKNLIKSNKVIEYNSFTGCKMKDDITTPLNIFYSGKVVCMNCGQLIDDDYYDEEDAGRVVCRECAGVEYCEYCNCYTSGVTYEIDGMTICDCCYDSSVGTDDLTGEEHFYNNMEQIYIVKEPDETIPFGVTEYSFYTLNPHEINWDQYLVEGHKGLVDAYLLRKDWYRNNFYTILVSAICISDIRKEVLKERLGWLDLPDDFLK